MEKKAYKEKVRNQIQQKIAVANIRKEFAKQKKKQKKILYGISAVCAVTVICFGICLTQGRSLEEAQKYQTVADLGSGIHKESLTMEWKINLVEETQKSQSLGKARSDITSNTYPLEQWPEKSLFLKEVLVPEGYTQKDCYAFFVQNPETKEYTLVHDYILLYEKGENQQIRIACSELGEPIRDYGFPKGEEIAQIGDQDLSICQYQDRYFITFQRNDLYWDIETVGVTEEQLKEFLIAFLVKSKEITQKTIEDGEDNSQEPIHTTNVTSFPEYYGGRYVDKQGNHVILLCQDNSDNREEICKILRITKSKTKFQTATYSYTYLLELQNKISAKMVAKELPFVSTSALLEDKNRIQVTVHTNKETDVQKLKDLDSKGGAIKVEYQEGAQSKTELLLEKE